MLDTTLQIVAVNLHSSPLVERHSLEEELHTPVVEHHTLVGNPSALVEGNPAAVVRHHSTASENKKDSIKHCLAFDTKS